MKVIRRSPNKFWLFVGGKAFSLRIENAVKQAETEVRLIPRWRTAGALMFTSFSTAAALFHGQVGIGAFLAGAMLVCLWAASR